MPNAAQATIIFSSGQLSADVVLTGNIKDGELVNADFNAAAAIARSKLNFGSGLVDADVAAAAAIAQSKLSLSITNAEINAAAAIVDTKLATISSAGKVSGAALSSLGSIPAGAGTIPATNAPGSLVILGKGNGTNNSAVAANFATLAISGLTALDTLMVVFGLSENASGPCTGLMLYNNTDSLKLLDIDQGNNLGASESLGGVAYLMQEPQSSTRVFGINVGGGTSQATGNNVQSTNGTSSVRSASLAFTTAWTGSWTLALRHSGIQTAGILTYNWIVYKILGQ